MQILNSKQMSQKIDRMAFEILERNYPESSVYLLGINNMGYDLARLLKERIEKINIADTQAHLLQIKVNPSDPLAFPAHLVDGNIADLKDKHVIIIDDVANTGRTIFYAFEVLLRVIPSRVEVAVMVDRKHKLFPVHVDYMGLSLATTLKEHIKVNLSSVETMETLLH